MTRRLVFSPEAEAQFASLYRYIATQAGLAVAESFMSGVLQRCESLTAYPFLGPARDDVLPGLRTFSYRRRVTIAYRVAPDRIDIAGLFYAGQDFEALLREGG